jgi:hypothetical protein
LISISQPNGLPISAREAAQIQYILGQSVNWLWFGIMVVGAIYAWRLAWIAWQSFPGNRRRRPKTEWRTSD